ncbi:MAG: caspase family protein, partial [Geminicoccaceae bacterium]|nr:caspase family protein [Geminicoccaceae bacterium]
EFLVVDCTLPAQVRRLGSKLTYLGVRRPIRTSGLDCAIRGGEYVAYDRADYQTALRVWMEPALTGDPEAQNYVGEILERGLGTPPNYVEAASWYRKAAEQGFGPAQINLGQLYEQGLGVEKDPVVALNWYRKAADFEQAGLTFVASSDTAAEIESLRSQVGQQSAEAERLQDEMRRLQVRIADLRQQQGAGGAATVDPAALQELEAARADIEQTKEQIEAERAGAEQARRELEAERTRLETARAEAAAATSELDQKRAALDAERRRLQAQEEELQLKIDQATSISVEQAARRDLDEVEAQLREFDEQEQAIADRARALAEKASELDQVEAEIGARIEQLQSMKAAEAEMKASVSSMREEKSALDQEIDQLRMVFEEQRRRLEQMNETSDIALAGPTITLVDPPLPQTLTRGTPIVRTRSGVAERQIVGRIEAPAGVLTLVVNDLVVPLEDKNLFRAAVPVTDEGTRVSLVAIDRQGKRDDLEFLIEPGSNQPTASPAAAPEVVAEPVIPDLELGNFHALVIGNNDYQYLPDLESAVTDARAVAEVLSEKYRFEVTLLEDATRYDILSVLNDLRGRLTEQDNLLIYYAGHGELDRANMRGHWLPVDAEIDSSANWISNVQITDLLNAMSAKRILVVADSCYSGALTRAAIANLESGMSDQARLAWLKAVAAKRARTALTSGGLAPTMDGGGGDHSVFAAAFLDVLRENDGLIEGQRLFQEISARVTFAASKYRFEQVPQYAPIKFAGHEAGEFFLRPGV